MFYLKIDEKEIDYNKLFEYSNLTDNEKEQYIKIIKNLNKEIKNNKYPTIFKYINNRELKPNEDHLILLTMLMIIEKEGGINKIKEKADYYFNEIKKYNHNTYDIWISYNCSLLMFYNSIYNLDVELFHEAKIGMDSINCYLKDKNLLKYEDNEGEIFNVIDVIYDYESDNNE